MKNRKTTFLKIAALCSTTLLMTSFVAMKSGAFNQTQTSIVSDNPSDTTHKRDTLILADVIIISDSSFYKRPYMPSSKVMVMDDRPKFVGVTKDTIPFGSARADSILLAKKVLIIEDPVYMGGSKSGPMFNPQQSEPVFLVPEKSSKKTKVKNKK